MMMARTTGKASLADLLAAGKLVPGERMILRRRSKPDVNGVLLKSGAIKIGDETFKTPSGAARAALAAKATDGWIRWRVPRLGDATLADIREGA